MVLRIIVLPSLFVAGISPAMLKATFFQPGPLRYSFWMLGSLCLAVLNSPSAHAQWTGEAGEQTAVAVPRIALPGASEIALPQPLLPSDAARIRRAFALQEHGALSEAALE